jgi:ubiquinone/menaquinone biosynthesis C-methylase UbiE
MYATIASQIVQRTGVKSGNAIDLGGGPGMLGMALAKMTDLNVTVVDMLQTCVSVAEENIRSQSLQNRMTARRGVADDLAEPDVTIDLVASRGSIFFWQDQKKGLSEVYRELKPGGGAYIGGGFGSSELLRKVEEARSDNPEWSERRRERIKKILRRIMKDYSRDFR